MSFGSALGRRCRSKTAAVLIALALTGCAGPSFVDMERDEVFAAAVEASLDERSSYASAAAYSYFRGANVDDPRYDRAMRLLALNSERMGFSYAASLWYLEIARARRDVALVSEAVLGLERVMSTYPHDRSTLVRGFIATAEITGLPPRQQAFVAYHQGLDSVLRGLDDWADSQFAQIPSGSEYALRARYVQLMRLVSAYELDEAIVEIEALLEEKNIPEDLRLEAQRTLARVDFERARWDDALERYETLRQSAPDDPSLLLEMAWTHYYRGEYQRALGLLLALDAPSYGGLIAPERYLLEALSLQKLCQFEPAQRAAVRLRIRHGDAIDDLYNGVPLRQSVALRNAARQRNEGQDVARYRARLARERVMIDEMEGELGKELADGLRAVYDRGLQEAARREDAELERVMVAVGDDLLAAEEGVRLILHELGVSLLRGRRNDPGEPERILTTERFDPQNEVQYLFEGEFWTDELDDIVVRVEDRCID